MNIQNNLHLALKIAPTPWPWSKMILSLFTISIPLLIGLLNDQFDISMFGALFSLVLILIDHYGPLKNRIHHLLTTYFFLCVSLILGYTFINYNLYTYIILFVSAFVLGKVKNNGIELERIILFSILYFLTIADSPGLKNKIILPIVYSSLALAIYLVTLIVITLNTKANPEIINSKKNILKSSISISENNHFSLYFACATSLSFLLAKLAHLDRAYWVTGTVLIVMLPDRNQSIQKAFQRIFGTILGVLIAGLILSFSINSWVILFFTACFASLFPLGMVKNYWLGNLFIAALIIFFIETAKIKPNIFQLSMLRIVDIGIGCLFGAAAMILYHFFKQPNSIKIK